MFRKVLSCGIVVILACWAAHAGTFSGVVVRTGADAGAVELRAAELLAGRLTEPTGVPVRVESEAAPSSVADGECLVLLGRPEHHRALAALFEQHRIPELTWLEPGVEGFLLQTAPGDAGTVIAAGIDDRGCLYAVGELLRQAEFSDAAAVVSLPNDLDVRTAPAFEWRGTQIGQNGRQQSLAHTRERTEDELHRTLLDYVLAGANIFDIRTAEEVAYCDSWALKTRNCYGPNTGRFEGHPEWEAKESIGRPGYICLSIPEARQAAIERCDAYFREFPSVDLVQFYGGDGGGCECDQCEPYGRPFIETVEAMAKAVLKYHPDAKINFTNQKFDNADDEAILDYIATRPHDWLYAWGFCPGSDATTWQPGHRQTHRMDLFRYPGYGPYAIYPRELLRRMPADVELIYGNEITHWRYAQHAYIQKYPRADRNGDQPPHWSHEIYERRPDRFLTQVYDRRTFFAWPRYYHRVFSDLMHYGIGDVTHSSGLHDHFNQWMWMRLLWNPRQSPEQVVDEYSRTFFGKEAAPYMAEAIFLLEEYLEDDMGRLLPEKGEVEHFVALCRKAGEVMPAWRMKGNWLWRVYMQKGLVDRWIQLGVTQQMAMQADVEGIVRRALDEGSDLDKAIKEARSRAKASWRTPEMAEILGEAMSLGEESNALIAFRNEGMYNLDRDFIGLKWLRRQLKRAGAARDPEEKTELLRMIPHYEDPGEGGYYDNLGTGNACPHVVFGYPFDHGQPYIEEMLDDGNRYSQREMHYTQDEDQGLTLQYDRLDPSAEYRVRFTLVRPWYEPRYDYRMNQKSESIYADDAVLAADLELPYHMSDFFTFDVPKDCTADGELTIRFERAADVAHWDRVTNEQWRNAGGWGTLCSEVWLIKKPADE